MSSDNTAKPPRERLFEQRRRLVQAAEAKFIDTKAERDALIAAAATQTTANFATGKFTPGISPGADGGDNVLKIVFTKGDNPVATKANPNPGSMVYGNTVSYRDEESVSYAGLASYLMVDIVGQRTEIVFQDWQRNVTLAPATFRFDPPPGVDVVGDVRPGAKVQPLGD